MTPNFVTSLALLALAQAPAAPPAKHAPAPSAPSASDAAPEPAPPPVEPWPGTVTEGLHELRALAEGGDPAAARALGTRLLAPTPFLRWKETALAAGGWRRRMVQGLEPVLDALGFEALSPRARAEVRFASGVAAAKGEDRAGAASDFESARALAGPGELRLASGYQLATTALLEAEALRAQIPELQPQGAQGQPATPPGMPALPGVPGGQPGAEGPDPIAVARSAYLVARERFVERLRADWNDADTRANTELVMKRLRELDELEKKREEQKKQQQKDDPNQDPEQQNDSKDKQDQKDPSKDPKDPKDDPKDTPPDQPKDEKPPEEPKPEDAEQEPPKDPPPPQPGEERELSKEELTRLLDLLKQREQQWKKLQAQMQQARRAKVKKDW
jgi:hypothetical protein